MSRADEPRDLTGPVDLVDLYRALEGLWIRIREDHPDLPRVVFTVGSGSDARHPGSLKRGHFAPVRWVKRTPEAGTLAARLVAVSRELGHEDRPIHEVFLAGERMADGATGVACTLIHEAAHALNVTRNIQDTSRERRYHNRNFADMAEALGLEVRQAGDQGWTDTRWTDAAEARYLPELEALRRSIRGYRRAEADIRFLFPGDVPGMDPGEVPGPVQGQGPADPADPEGDDPRVAAFLSGLRTGRKRPGRLLASCSCGRSFRIARSVYELGPIVCSACGQAFQVVP